MQSPGINLDFSLQQVLVISLGNQFEHVAASLACDFLENKAEIKGASTLGLEDAMEQGLAGAVKTICNARGAWVKEQHMRRQKIYEIGRESLCHGALPRRKFARERCGLNRTL